MTFLALLAIAIFAPTILRGLAADLAAIAVAAVLFGAIIFVLSNLAWSQG